MLPANHIALLIDKRIIKGIPELVTNRTLLGNNVSVIELNNDLDKAIERIPENTDTLLVAPVLYALFFRVKI